MTTTPATAPPSIVTHPYAVGRVVYRTRAEAEAAIERAAGLYPESSFAVLDRATGRPVHLVAPRIVRGDDGVAR